MKIHHIGYAVKCIEKAEKVFQSMGYNAGNEITEDEKRNVRIKFISLGEDVVELVEPSNENSPIFNLLKKNGPATYHICYEVENIDDKIKELKKNGFMVISDISAAPAIDEKSVAFLFNKDIGLIELLEK